MNYFTKVQLGNFLIIILVPELPEGYRKEVIFSATNSSRKYIKVISPGGKIFKSIKAANEYHMKTGGVRIQPFSYS